MSEDKKIVIFDVATVIDDASKPKSDNLRGLSEKTEKIMVMAREIGVEQLQKNMMEFVSSIQGMLTKGAEIQGDYQLNSIEIEASISAEGTIGFAGTGVGLSGNTGLRFIFTKSTNSM